MLEMLLLDHQECILNKKLIHLHGLQQLQPAMNLMKEFLLDVNPMANTSMPLMATM